MPSSPSKHLDHELLCDVFISHQGTDTKRTAAGLLYDRFKLLQLHPFFDSKSMKPGDKLFDKIGAAIVGCKVGVLIFSPNYCSSYFCLHELALLMECNKKVIPIYWDVNASDLKVVDNGNYTAEELKRFRWAVEEAKQFVALTFDSRSGDWSEFLTSTNDIVVRSLIELEEEEGERCYNTLSVW
ncbi:TIR-only protein-like [Macadamia integrifolia]|uniref:TIR-only protein-like n=1 Tax=Macadamia integrifolia TaxID=60698 RepID=UPI001C4E608E|nr:TIR-only protein-like [Macadamia integrifolia]